MLRGTMDKKKYIKPEFKTMVMETGCFDLGVASGKYDSDGRKNEDYSQLT